MGEMESGNSAIIVTSGQLWKEEEKEVIFTLYTEPVPLTGMDVETEKLEAITKKMSGCLSAIPRNPVALGKVWTRAAS